MIKKIIRALSLSAAIFSFISLVVDAQDIQAKTKVSLFIGDSYKIKTQKNTKYTFVSKNKKIAKVTKKGIITGLRKGKCKVVVKTKGKKTVYSITVKNNKKTGRNNNITTPISPISTDSPLNPVSSPNPTQAPNGPKIGGERVIAQGIIKEIEQIENGKYRYKLECSKFSFTSVSDNVKYAYVTVNQNRGDYIVGNEVMLFSFSDVDYVNVDESTISFNVDFIHLVQ